MRRWLLVLMVALLPLRTWAGDAMAVQMAAASPASVAMQAGMGHPPECPGHMAAADAGGPVPDAQHAGTDPACASCTLCQVCSTVALDLPAPLPSLAPPSQGVPAWSAGAFASAAVALLFKPPIS